jgi:uncharacterized protein (TIGR01777 family)
MRIVITGGTGFIGRALAAALAGDGHDVAVLSRFSGGTYQNVRHVRAQVQQNRYDTAAVKEIDGAGAVINLAGAGIGDARWTPARKALLRESRLSITRAMAAAIREAAAPPPVFISGSGTGYYGSSLDHTFDESSPAGADFLATLCVEWEQAARDVESDRCRVVISRTGLVLGPGGGLLKKMTPPFKLFVGGPIGSGRQWMSWIHRDDWIAMIRWAIATESIRGPLNVTASNPVINRDFSTALGHALHRPSIFPVPAFVLRGIFGEMADGALLASQRVMPMKAQAGGFTFKYPDLDAALRAST